MSSQPVVVETLPNGMTVLIEPMDEVESAAFALMVPGGSLYDAPGLNGCAAALCDLITRGAGSRDSRALSIALDRLGLQRHESVERRFLSFGGATIGRQLLPALEIYADIVQRPHLPEEHFEAVVEGCLQSVLAIEDEPRQKLLVELKKRCYKAPWGLPAEGSLEGLEALSLDDVQRHFSTTLGPKGAILGVAGAVDPAELLGLVERCYGGWPPQQEASVATGPDAAACGHLPQESAQTQIGIAFPSVPYRHPDYYAAWAAASILGGGSSSRLFTEVRERRGLCYNVFASLHSFRDEARVLCYAGTLAERAQETLDVTLNELARFPRGIERAELERCQARAKSALIMQQESSSGRAAGLAHDWYHLERVVTLEEVRRRVEGLTVDCLERHLAEHPPRDFTLLTLGPSPLTFPGA